MACVALIGPLPAADDDLPESGVAQYLRDLADAMPADADLVVVAQKGAQEASTEGVRVTTTWDAGLRAPLQIAWQLCRLRPAVVHLQQEFNLFGGLLPTMLTVLVVALARVTARPLIITVHGVVNLNDVTSEFVTRNDLPRHLFVSRTAFRFAYLLLSICATRIIVHHEHFRETLSSAYSVPLRKVTVIPQGASPVDLPERTPSAAPVVLVLGFLTGYKAPEVVVDLADSTLLPGARFRFCVGENPRVVSDAYRRRYDALRTRISALDSSRASMTGFVPEDELPSVFAEADVLVLPYSHLLAGSGVAALAREHGLPFCYSAQMSPLFGAGPNCFELGDQRSLAEAIEAAGSGLGVSTDLFTSWDEVVTRTRLVYRQCSKGHIHHPGEATSSEPVTAET